MGHIASMDNVYLSYTDIAKIFKEVSAIML